MTVIDENLSREEVAAVVSEALTRAGLDAVLSGGSVVSIYSDNEYESYDLDFVTSATLRDLTSIMKELGFQRGKGRHFTHPRTKYFVEFPSAPLAVGGEPITEWKRLKTGKGVIQILTSTQCVMDRLAAFYHWNDRQALDQAIMVARRQPVDVEKIES